MDKTFNAFVAGMLFIQTIDAVLDGRAGVAVILTILCMLNIWAALK